MRQHGFKKLLLFTCWFSSVLKCGFQMFAVPCSVSLLFRSVADGAAYSPWAVQFAGSQCTFLQSLHGVDKVLLLSDYQRALPGDALQSNGDAFVSCHFGLMPVLCSGALWVPIYCKCYHLARTKSVFI